MTLRGLTTFALGAAAAIALATGAQAAITVLGNGLAKSCYEAAEFGGEAHSGIITCTSALDQDTLSIRDRAATLINRGILRSRTDDATGAMKDYDAGLKTDSSLAEGYVDRGAALLTLHRYKEALVDLNKGIDMGARQPQIAYYDRAIVNEALGDIRGAYEDYKKAVEIQPDFTLAIHELQRFRVVHKYPGGA
jgi:tetratricopeptide (TPR) repeat protein